MKLVHLIFILAFCFLGCSEEPQDFNFIDIDKRSNEKSLSCCESLMENITITKLNRLTADGCCRYNITVPPGYCPDYHLRGARGNVVPDSQIPIGGTTIFVTGCPGNDKHNNTYYFSNGSDDCESFTLPACPKIIITVPPSEQCVECPGTPSNPDCVCNYVLCEWDCSN